MALSHEKTKSPYHGMFVVILFLILVPLLCWVLFRYVVFTNQKQFSDELNGYASIAMGTIVGIFFHLACMVAGVFKASFRAVKLRLYEFSENAKISAKLAFSCYRQDLKEGGVVFWIYMTIVLANLWLFIFSLTRFLQIYQG